jgi:hypothetical protein
MAAGVPIDDGAIRALGDVRMVAQREFNTLIIAIGEHRASQMVLLTELDALCRFALVRIAVRAMVAAIVDVHERFCADIDLLCVQIDRPIFHNARNTNQLDRVVHVSVEVDHTASNILQTAIAVELALQALAPRQSSLAEHSRALIETHGRLCSQLRTLTGQVRAALSELQTGIDHIGVVR